MDLESLILYCKILSETDKCVDILKIKKVLRNSERTETDFDTLENLLNKSYNKGYLSGVLACMKACGCDQKDVELLQELIDKMVL